MDSLSGKDFIIKDLKKKIQDLEAENNYMNDRLKEITEERDEIRYCLDETRKSFSYRLGYKLTTIPRKIREFSHK